MGATCRPGCDVKQEGINKLGQKGVNEKKEVKRKECPEEIKEGIKIENEKESDMGKLSEELKKSEQGMCRGENEEDKMKRRNEGRI